MERKDKNTLYFIKNKINNNDELLTALQHIYEDEEAKNSLIHKKEIKKNKFDRYLSACVFNEYSSLNFFIVMSVLFMISCLSEPRIGLSGFIFIPFLLIPVFDVLFTSYKRQKTKKGFFKHSKKMIISSFSSLLNKTNSLGRKKYNLYANELSLRSLEEISKYISKEEMDLLLKSKLDYESLNIYKENLRKEKEYKDINKYIENDLNINKVRNNLVENLYKDKA